jgi:hypothetical protein
MITETRLVSGCPCGGCDKSHDPGEVAGWHQHNGPGPLLRQRHHKSTLDRPAHWVDHHYRLRQPDRTWTYVAEPYDLSDEAIADLGWLQSEHGYRISVAAHAARHYPGGTVAVILRPPTSG